MIQSNIVPITFPIRKSRWPFLSIQLIYAPGNNSTWLWDHLFYCEKLGWTEHFRKLHSKVDNCLLFYPYGRITVLWSITVFSLYPTVICTSALWSLLLLTTVVCMDLLLPVLAFNKTLLCKVISIRLLSVILSLACSSMLLSMHVTTLPTTLTTTVSTASWSVVISSSSLRRPRASCLLIICGCSLMIPCTPLLRWRRHDNGVVLGVACSSPNLWINSKRVITAQCIGTLCCDSSTCIW